MKYLLDTCIIQAVLKREPGSDNLQVRIEAAQRGTLAISALTAVEIWVGLARPRTPRARRILFEGLLRHMRILAFDEAAARQAYTVRRHLEQTGQDIGRMDPLHRGPGHGDRLGMRHRQSSSFPADSRADYRELAATGMTNPLPLSE